MATNLKLIEMFRLICIKVVIFLHSSEIICNFAAKNYMSVV